jgi:alpha-beta hydrolase superfamily lysophospholipase
MSRSPLSAALNRPSRCRGYRRLWLIRAGVALVLALVSAAAHAAPAHFTSLDFITDDGTPLPLRKWLPRGPVKAVILALHGFNDYSNAFDTPAKFWAEQGIATYAYDQRGFGGAPGRGLWPGDVRLAYDAITATRILRLIHPGRPVYLLGESMGGAVATLAITGAIPNAMAAGSPRAAADGLILSAPAVWGRSTIDLFPKLALFTGARLFPDTVLTGSGLRILPSDNLMMLRALGRDPMMLRGARVDTIYGLVDLMDDAVAAAPYLTMPALLLYGAHDQIIPPRALREFVAQFPPDHGHLRRLAYYPQGYHLLTRDLHGAVVAADVARWVLDPAAPLPSQADAMQDTRPWPPTPSGG